MKGPQSAFKSIESAGKLASLNSSSDISCESVGELFKLSVPQLSHLWNGTKNMKYFEEEMWLFLNAGVACIISWIVKSLLDMCQTPHASLNINSIPLCHSQIALFPLYTWRFRGWTWSAFLPFSGRHLQAKFLSWGRKWGEGDGQIYLSSFEKKRFILKWWIPDLSLSSTASNDVICIQYGSALLHLSLYSAYNHLINSIFVMLSLFLSLAIQKKIIVSLLLRYNLHVIKLTLFSGISEFWQMHTIV